MDETVERYIARMQRRKERKTERYYLDLQDNEQALLQAASRIYAAYIASGRVTDEENDEWLDRSLYEAVKLAYRIERTVQDAAEGGSSEG